MKVIAIHKVYLHTRKMPKCYGRKPGTVHIGSFFIPWDMGDSVVNACVYGYNRALVRDYFDGLKMSKNKKEVWALLPAIEWVLI